MNKKEKEASFDDLWDAAEEYVSISNEDLKAATVAAFKKKPGCIYLEKKDIESVLSIEGKPYLEYIGANFDDDYLENHFTDTVNGEYLIFHNIYNMFIIYMVISI